MAIVYYPNSVVKKYPPVVDKLQRLNTLETAVGSKDLNTGALDTTIWYPGNYEISRVAMHFDGAASKIYSADIVQGRGIVTGANDKLFFLVNAAQWGLITLSQGFYNGTTLATEIKTQLDANTDFVAQGSTPFTVSYTAATGVFSIAPAAGMIQYFETNHCIMPVLGNRSTAANVVGLNQDSAMVAAVVSDTVVPNLGVGTSYFSGTSTALNVLGTDTLPMTVDNGLRLQVNSVATTVHYEVLYKVLN